jgi:hypothetical protein
MLVGPDRQRFLESRALTLSIAAIRKAQGRKNPGNHPVCLPGWEVAAKNLVRDAQRAIRGDPG